VIDAIAPGAHFQNDPCAVYLFGEFTAEDVRPVVRLDAPTFTDPVLYSTAPTASLAGAAEISALTHHELAINGSMLN